MANSYLLYTGNGSTTQYSLAGIDGWISTGFLKVYFNDNVAPEATNSYTFVDLTTAPKIQFTVAPPNNTVIRIQRETPSLVSTFRSNVVDFEDTSILTADDLDKALQGALHIVQEANDTGSGALPPTADGTHWNAESKRITNTGVPTGPNDAVNKAYADGMILYGSTTVTQPQSWTFSGDSTTTDFTFSPTAATTDPAMFIVEVGGTIQQPTTDYTVTASTLSFVSAPATGVDNIRVRNLGVTRSVQSFPSNVTFDQNITVTGSASAATMTVGGLTVGRAGADTNAVLGKTAGASISSGGNNVVIGNNAGAGVDTGNLNICIGSGANTSSGTSDAVAIGRNARAGTACVALGNYALLAGASTSDNVAAGHSAIVNCTGSSNVAVGAYSGATLTTGIQNVLIGRSANVQAAGNNNSIVIGASATGAGTNTTVIGNSSTTNTIIPAGALTVAAGNLAVSTGNLAVSTGNLAVSTGNATIAGTLGVSGAATLDSLGVTNNATVGGTLAVTGQATFGSVGQSLVNKQFSDSPVSGASVIAAFPTWARRVTISFAAVSSSGTSYWSLHVRRGGTRETANYKSRVLHHGVAWADTTAAFLLTRSISATNFYTGTYVLDRVDTAGTIWCLSGQMMDDGANTLFSANGHYAGGTTPITGVEVLPSVSPQVWDGGRISISWE